MNRYILIRRLRGPAFLLLIGLIALLHSTALSIASGTGSGRCCSFCSACCCWPSGQRWPRMGAIRHGPSAVALSGCSRSECGQLAVPPYTGQATAIVPAARTTSGKIPNGGQS